ncbi:MAG TPA: hypothetical protein VJU83_13000 [Burkholderiales bacterium]|nr:hypothetical protein [Burkholderiales bacterium]
MAAGTRWTLYLIALVATLVTIFHDDEEKVQALPLAHAVEATRLTTDGKPFIAQAIPLEKLQRQSGTAPTADPFSARSWQQMEEEEERRNAPPPAAPPKPQAPPLPFGYLGKMVEGEQTVVFLTARDRNYVARLGDTLDGVWRVAEIRDQDMVFDYVPLKSKQSLSFMAGGSPATAMPRSLDGQDDEEEEKEE